MSFHFCLWKISRYRLFLSLTLIIWQVKRMGDCWYHLKCYGRQFCFDNFTDISLQQHTLVVALSSTLLWQSQIFLHPYCHVINQVRRSNPIRTVARLSTCLSLQLGQDIFVSKEESKRGVPVVGKNRLSDTIGLWFVLLFYLKPKLLLAALFVCPVNDNLSSQLPAACLLWRFTPERSLILVETLP